MHILTLSQYGNSIAKFILESGNWQSKLRFGSIHWPSAMSVFEFLPNLSSLLKCTLIAVYIYMAKAILKKVRNVVPVV